MVLITLIFISRFSFLVILWFKALKATKIKSRSKEAKILTTQNVAFLYVY